MDVYSYEEEIINSNFPKTRFKREKQGIITIGRGVALLWPNEKLIAFVGEARQTAKTLNLKPVAPPSVSIDPTKTKLFGRGVQEVLIADWNNFTILPRNSESLALLDKFAANNYYVVGCVNDNVVIAGSGTLNTDHTISMSYFTNDTVAPGVSVELKVFVNGVDITPTTLVLPCKDADTECPPIEVDAPTVAAIRRLNEARILQVMPTARIGGRSDLTAPKVFGERDGLAAFIGRGFILINVKNDADLQTVTREFGSSISLVPVQYEVGPSLCDDIHYQALTGAHSDRNPKLNYVNTISPGVSIGGPEKPASNSGILNLIGSLFKFSTVPPAFLATVGPIVTCGDKQGFITAAHSVDNLQYIAQPARITNAGGAACRSSTRSHYL